MKKFMSIMLALGLAIGTASITMAQDKDDTKKADKKKKGSKKKGDAKDGDAKKGGKKGKDAPKDDKK